MKTTNNIARSLYVVALALGGLSFYALLLAAVVLLGGLLLSAYSHAQTPTDDAIDASFTGAWYDPAQPGHGLFLEVLPGNKLLAYWLAFDPAGDQQAWFLGVGSFSGNTATLSDVTQPSGGRWIPNFDSSAVVNHAWGSLVFTFSDHDNGRVDFASALDYGSGSMRLARLTAPSRALLAVDAAIGPAVAVTGDSAGNVYFSSSPNRIFKIDAQGALTRIAGSGDAGYAGDGGPARAAQLNFPLSYPERVQDPIDFSELVGGLALDGAGNLYVADAYNNRIRRIAADGIITTIAGDGARGSSGDGGPAANARFWWPQGLAIGPGGTVRITDANGTLREIAANGTISKRVGNNCGSGFLGRGLCVPEQIAVDAAGNTFVPDGYCRVRKVSPQGNVVTIAGDDHDPSNGFAFTCGYSGDGGPAVNAALSNSPYAVAVDAGNNVYIADTFNHCIRKIDGAGIIHTVAGACTSAGFAGDGGAATNALLNQPHGVAVDAFGNLLIADTGNNRVRRVSANGVIETIAGNGAALPTGVAIGPAFTGSWSDPAQSGHGLVLEVLPGHSLLAYWFTFNPAGDQQAWFGGIGPYSGNTASIAQVDQTIGGSWVTNFDPHQIVHQPWGSLNLTFTDCNHGRVDFASTLPGYGSGHMDLTRLTLPEGLQCP